MSPVCTPQWPHPTATTDTSEVRQTDSTFRFRAPAAEWYIPRREEQLIKDILGQSTPPNLLITGRTGAGKSSLLNWLAGYTKATGAQIIKCLPLSDTLRDLLALLNQHLVELLDILEIPRPALSSIPELDLQTLLRQLLRKHQGGILILIDQIERLLPFGAGANARAHEVWRALMDAIGGFKTHASLTWIFAAKEWYFLALFPSELQLRSDSFTYLTIGDLQHTEACALLERLALLEEVEIEPESIDLLATKAGGRALTLVLTFIVAKEQSVTPKKISYQYLAENEPWNEIFEADYSCLASDRQRRIILALAHEKRELVPISTITRKVSEVESCSVVEVEEEIRQLDHNYGILVEQEGFVSFVHSGFGIYIDRKHSPMYPQQWATADIAAESESKERINKEFDVPDVPYELTANILHHMANMLVSIQYGSKRLSELLDKEDWHGAKGVNKLLQQSIEQTMDSMSTWRSLAFPIGDLPASTPLKPAVEAVVRQVKKLGRRIILKDDHIPTIIRVPGTQEELALIFGEIINNAFAHSQSEDIIVTIRFRVDPQDHDVLCHVEDTGSGISAALIDKIFLPSFTTSPRGTGMGLYFIRSIMRKRGGDIWLERTSAQGSVFTLVFPIVAAEEAQDS
jgi:signal transduction histidine kinase